MTEKRILLVGDGNHQFITNYATWINKATNNNFTVDILSFTPVRTENEKYYHSVFQKKNITTLSKFFLGIKGIRRYYRFYLLRELSSKLPEYNFIHFHFIDADSYFLVNRFRKTTSKIILSIWGSDMYWVRPIDENGFFDTCNKADVLTFTNKLSIDYFVKKYKWNKNNIKLCRFGLAPLENLKELTLTRNDSKKLLNWNTEKLAVTIGYNMAPAQQHIEILSQFDNDEIKCLKDKIQLILPLTYGGTPKYKNKLLEKLKELSFEYKIYDTFLTDEQIAQIRKASDIMIQLQKTDQFSGSMQEHLYARNVIITGSWLPYETMKEHGAWFIEIDNLKQLSQKVYDVICNFEHYEQKTVRNPQAIAELGFWEKNIHNWVNIYETI